MVYSGRRRSLIFVSPISEVLDQKAIRDQEDRELVKKSIADPEMFARIIERYEKPIIRYISRISFFSSEECEEIAQEVFVRVWKNLRGYDENISFSSWIYHIARNETINTFHKEKSRGREHRAEWNDEELSNLPGNLDSSREMDQKISAKNVGEVLKMIPQKYRDILVLRYLEELEYLEIADVLHIPPGTVATLLHRAKKAFSNAGKRANIFDIS